MIRIGGGALPPVAILTAVLATGGAGAAPGTAPVLIGTPVGGGLSPGVQEEHLSEDERLEIEQAIALSTRALEAEGRLSGAAALPEELTWPLLPVNGLRDPGYHATYYLVDLDPNFPNQVLDYACGDRTYDNALGYNHQGTDFVPWPFRWTRFEDSQIAVVAAAPGTIVFKQEGHPDYDCTSERTMWNAVYVLLADGSVAWYGHLKEGSLTPKGIGETVFRGEVLGLVGSSGTSSGPHLHFEVHDPNGAVIDPHEGPCNAGPSRWASQRPYHDSAINRLATGFAPPGPLAACPGGEAANEAVDFAPGSTIWFTAYYRDQRGPALDPAGAETQYAIYGPDGIPVLSWSHSSQADWLAGSYWSFDVAFPAGTAPGIYRFEAVYQGLAYDHWFSIGGPFPSGAAPGDSSEGAPLSATLEPGGDLTLDWGASCAQDDSDYEIYQGTLRAYGSHEPVVCSTGGLTTATFAPSAGSAYYLVVPTNGVWEGSYGRTGAGAERPPATFGCRPQLTGACN